MVLKAVRVERMLLHCYIGDWVRLIGEDVVGLQVDMGHTGVARCIVQVEGQLPSCILEAAGCRLCVNEAELSGV